MVLPNFIGVYDKPNEKLFAYIEAVIRPSYQTAIISNIARDRMVELMGKERRTLFDEAVLSFAVGYSKPDKRIYEIALERLGVKGDECIFIDDIAEYCEAAAALGMKAIHFLSTEQCIEELSVLVGVTSER